MELIITATDNTDIIESLTAGVAQVHSVREDGTLRRRHFLVGQERQVAEWVRLQREGQEADEEAPAVDPRSMRSIANEMHLSIAAVRRILIDLAITEEIEDMDQEELEAILMGAGEEE